jgi:hypothetical protein
MMARPLGRFGIATAVGQAAWAAGRQWRALPAEKRNRLQALLRQSATRPASLSASERQELSRLVRELDLGPLVRQVATGSASSRGRFRRR